MERWTATVVQKQARGHAARAALRGDVVSSGAAQRHAANSRAPFVYLQTRFVTRLG